ncbi:hypothetical protein [Acidovorax sp. Leaf78]|uniref:phage tail tube protein n=1 Tax=Acidovorax sp. Leaf78 TaxID=1736237 RepID=UPI0006FCFEB8|nr:hypothetical protein [Acidovorax sp. Leaf78]KQO23494.1 hypothetical protein ASF16_04850 [Acidovorax sp. Leaf78]
MEKMIWAGQGPVEIGIYDRVNGRAAMAYLTKLREVGCSTRTLTMSLTQEKKPIKETCSGNKLTLATIPGAKTMNVSLELVEFNGPMFAAALFSQLAENDDGTVTAEQFATLSVGDTFFLKHPNASSIVLEDSTATPVTLIEGTHYEILSAAHGTARLLSVAGIAQPIFADYAYGAYESMAAFSQPSTVERGMVFSGINHDGRKARLIVPRLDLAMDGDFSWIQDEEASLTFSGEALYVPELAGDPLYGSFARVDWLAAP